MSRLSGSCQAREQAEPIGAIGIFRFIGGLSDPFQPEEEKHRCTLEVLKVLKETQYPFIVSTKGRLVAEEPYLTLLSECNAVVQISMTSPLLDKLEKGAPTFKERIEMAEKVSPKVKRVIARVQPYLPQCKQTLIKALPDMKRAGIHGITIEGMKFKKKKPGTVRFGGDWAYPDDTLKRDYLEIRSHCRELGLAFWCAENRLRSLGDSTACCGCGDIPGFEGNPFNCASVKNGSGAVATEKTLQKGTACCFNHVYQYAGAPNLIKEKSFHEMMQNSAKMFI